MKTYTVKQIAKLLETNEETIRRWIRDGKLKSIQVSKKEGNVISQAQLDAFLKTSPKYLSRFAIGLAAITPFVGAAVGGGIGAAALMNYYRKRKKENVRVNQEDFKSYLQDQIDEELKEIEHKKELIQEIQAEITDLYIEVDKKKYLLKNEEALAQTMKTISEITGEEKA